MEHGEWISKLSSKLMFNDERAHSAMLVVLPPITAGGLSPVVNNAYQSGYNSKLSNTLNNVKCL